MNDVDIAIKIENISKRYRIGMKEDANDSFSSALFNFIKTPLKNFRKYRALYKFGGNKTNQNVGSSSNSSDILWALSDISFEVKRGEIVGIIGSNGAGKSSLLKILSRITDPTTGYIKIKGKVSSLLEVGTGFHPELTGRENVYLNSAILGMTKKEVDQKFDQIVDFSGVERFIDTPVKRYSSGMKVRLAFSVAAFLEPEVLIIDEVLAVGDADFQKKCLNKMEEISHQGRTVLFVSHNMPAVTSLCDRVLLLDEGRIIKDGLSRDVVNAYLNSESSTVSLREWSDASKAPGGEVARLRAVRVRYDDGEITDIIDIRKPVNVEMEYDVIKSGFQLLPNFFFWTEESLCAFGAQDLDPAWRKRTRPAGRYISTVRIPGNLFADGTMFVNANLNTLDPNIDQFSEKSAVAFKVLDSFDGDAARGDYVHKINGVVRPLLEWKTQFKEN